MMAEGLDRGLTWRDLFCFSLLASLRVGLQLLRSNENKAAWPEHLRQGGRLGS